MQKLPVDIHAITASKCTVDLMSEHHKCLCWISRSAADIQTSSCCLLCLISSTYHSLRQAALEREV